MDIGNKNAMIRDAALARTRKAERKNTVSVVEGELAQLVHQLKEFSAANAE